MTFIFIFLSYFFILKKEEAHSKRTGTLLYVVSLLYSPLWPVSQLVNPNSVGILVNPFFPFLSKVPTSWNTSPEHD